MIEFLSILDIKRRNIVEKLISFRFWRYRAAIFAFHGKIPQNLDRVWQVFENRARSEFEPLPYMPYMAVL